MDSIACMLMNMIEIESIHAFEDEAFLKAITRWSFAVMAAGTAISLAIAAWVDGSAATAEAATFVQMSDAWGPFGAVVAFLLLIVVLTAAALGVHECVHAAFFKLFAPKGSRVYLGAQWDKGMLYACAEGIVFSRGNYLAAVLAPTVAVTVLCVALGTVLGWPVVAGLVGTLHLSGCTGDWFYARRIASNEKITACEDTSWGVRFLGEELAEQDGEGAL